MVKDGKFMCEHNPACLLWRSWGAESKNICQLDDSHIRNLVKYVEHQRLVAWILGKSTAKYDGWQTLIEREARKRGMRPGALKKVLNYPDPYEVAVKKGLVDGTKRNDTL